MIKKLLVAVVVGVGLAGFAVPAAAGPVEGKKILLKQGKKFVTLAKKQAGIEAPSSVGGAFLQVCASNGQQATVDLAAPNFKLNANKSDLLKYKVKGKTTGVKSVVIKTGKTLKIVGKSSFIDMGEELDGVGYKLVIGELEHCGYFSPGTKDTGKVFKGKKSPAPVDCSDESLGCLPPGSPSGAFLY